MKDLLSAIKLLRIPFSVFLMPIFWFAISLNCELNLWKAGFVFVILHFFVYPASNGYNSWHDRDEGSIGGLKHPPKVTKELLVLVIVFDLISIIGAMLISPVFALLILIYLLVSKAYSYKKIRLKKYPIISTVVVTIFQGMYTYLAIQFALGAELESLFQTHNILLAIAATFFLNGSYPLTQIYQHEEDKSRGDITLSLKLGIWGTFIYAGISFALGGMLMGAGYMLAGKEDSLVIFGIATLPILILFGNWILKVKRDSEEANFQNTMLMNKVSSLALSAAYIFIFWMNCR